MTPLAAVFGARGSLLRRLVVNVVLALVACVALAGAILVYEFYDHLDENAEAALRREAEEIAAAIDPAAPHLGFDPDAPRFAGDAGAYRYTVYDADWRPVLGGELAPADDPALRAALARAAERRRMFDAAPDRIGFVARREADGATYYALATGASFRANRTDLALLRHEIAEQIGWVVFGVAAVLAAAILAARRGLRPLRQALVQADRIAPGAPERRLTADRLPQELRPLIGAVNDAFDRLERGYQAQRDFSSNVAHEIRTPLAVLRSSVDGVAEPALRAELAEDLGRLDRMFEQLIDLARAEAQGEAAGKPVDLRALARELAVDLGPGALRRGRALAVTGAEAASAVGHAGLLSVALGNLVRNALAYGPPGAEVEIEVTAAPPGWRVLDRGPGVPDALKASLFERFRRGGHAKGDPDGAGIGLAIVRAVAAAHGGAAWVEDRPGGGAAFVFALPAPGADGRAGPGPRRAG